MLRFLLILTAIFLTSCALPVKPRMALPPTPAPLVERAPAQENDDADKDKDEDSYDEAARFYLQKRVGAGSKLPVERYYAAKKHADVMPRYSLARRRLVTAGKRGAPMDATGLESVNNWQSLGPGNIGGRTRSLIIHPNDTNTMWAGSVGGGVWKTTDGGNSWGPLTDLLPSIGIGSMAIDPTNPDVLYAGTGEYYTGSSRGDSIRGAGIFKTSDGGATWTQLASTTSSQFYYVNKIAISPVNNQHIYAATWSGVWYSPDAGATFRNVLPRFSPNVGCQDLAIRTDQKADYLFASCGTIATSQTVVFRNTDASGAGTWDAVLQDPNMGRTSLALAPSNQSIVYALAASVETNSNYSGGGLLAVYASQTNGDVNTWETRVTNKDPNRLNTLQFTNPREAFADVCSNGKATYGNQGGYDNVIAVDPIDSNIVWTGGIDIFRSDDGGRNWGIAAFWQASGAQLAHADVHVLLFPPGYDGVANQTLFSASDGGIYRTSNARAATATGDRAACFPYPTQVAWTNLNNGYAVTQFYHGSVFPGGAAYMGGAQDNGTSRGSDATGLNGWEKLSGGDGAFTAVDPDDPNLIYVSSQNLALLRSTNGGVSYFSAVKGITENTANFLFIVPFQMDPANSKRLYIGGKTLWKTEDGAQNWTAVSAPIATANGSVSAIAIAPSDAKHVAFGTSTGQVYYSSAALTGDDKTVWSFSTPRTGYLSRLVFDPVNPLILYATYSQFKATPTQSHVYKSSDGGVTWAGIDGVGSTSMPDIAVFAIVVDPLNPQSLYVGTDIGVFVSLDGGATWARDDNPFADAVTETLTLDRTAGQNTLFAFTHGRGVWKLALPGSGPGCQYALSTNSIAASALGGSYPVTVTTDSACSWAALTHAGVALIQSPAGGKGSGTLTMTISQNPGTLVRTDTIPVQNQAIAIAQDPATAVTGNDELTSAFVIPQIPFVGLENTGAATENATDPVHTCTSSADYKSVWFLYTAKQSGVMRLSFKVLRSDTFGDAGSVAAAYQMNAGALGPQLACMVTPVSTAFLTTRFPQFNVVQGVTSLLSGYGPE